MTTPLQRRLPGIRFDAPAAAPDEALPRMDVAMFVGFTACGPIDVPVAVESLAEFEAVFGGELTLLEAEDGSPLRGLLHPSLRHFFSEGGRRAWVLRVADAAQAQTSLFPLQRMLLLRRSQEGDPWRIEPAFVAARSPGAWADAMQVFARCEGELLAVRGLGFDGLHLGLAVRGAPAAGLAVGDCLQLVINGDDRVQGRIAAIDVPAAEPGSGRLEQRVSLDRLVQLRAERGGARVVRVGWTEPGESADGTLEHRRAAHGEWLAAPGGARLRVRCRLPAATQLGPGELLRVAYAGGATAWMALERVQLTPLGNAAREAEAELQGRPWRVPVRLRPALLRAWLARGGTGSAQRVRAELGAAPTLEAAPQRLGGLALVPLGGTGASVFELPDDQRFHTTRQPLAQRAAQAFELAPADAALQRGARFALATPATWAAPGGEAMLLPLSVGPGLAGGLGARGLVQPALRRDGLERFDWRLFAEAPLAGFHADALADQAEALRLLGRTPRALRGLHALFGSVVDGPAEEPTLLAVPDAVQPGWQRLRQRAPARVLHAPSPAPAEPPPCSDFQDCSLTPLAAPAFLLELDADPDDSGRFGLHWSAPEPALQYTLEESARPGFEVANPLYEGTGRQTIIPGRPPGLRYYRVRAHTGARLSPWSAVLEVRSGRRDYAPLPPDPRHLLALHRLMLRAAAGRGDVLALLGLPAAHDWPAALAHLEALRAPLAAVPAGDPPPLGEDEARALSHGALHHPWLLSRRDDALIACPPEGAIAGQLARAALERGAWSAVAWQPLRDVIALGRPAGTAERQALLEAQLNPIVAQPRGFVAGSSETLLRDPDWRPVNVRRLMCLVRRAALRRGATYVFEPAGDELRRTVERAFEALMDELLQRGALAGTSAAQSYRVELGPELNTPARREAGRFHVDLMLAPALPLSFLTVRLVRHGDRLAAQELR